MQACSHAGTQWPSIAQAVGSILAIGAGFAYVGFSNWSAGRAAARAAARLAKHSVDRLTERMAALIDPAKPIEFALRGQRATEMISVMRELDISKLPPKYVELVASIRSAVFAVNTRIDEVLTDDAKRKDERRRRLYSAGRILTEARNELGRLQNQAPMNSSWKVLPNALSPAMQAFLAEASQASAAARP